MTGPNYIIRKAKGFVSGAVILIGLAPVLQAQNILGSNLILNGNAEAGQAGKSLSTVVPSIPNWTVTGSGNVLPYGLTNVLLATDPAPPDHAFNFFVSGPSNLGLTATLTQTIDVSSGAATIAAGNVKYTASAYLGTAVGLGLASPAQMAVAFQNASGQTFSTATLGPLGVDGNGLMLQQQIGLVPSGTVKILVTLTLKTTCENAAACGYGAADSLSLVLTTLSTSAGMVLGSNQVVNGNAESGPSARFPAYAPYLPGWSTSNYVSVCPYGGTGWIQTTDPAPADEGVKLFCAASPGQVDGVMYQDIDVSPAAALIDAGQVTYQISAWLGGLPGYTSPTLTYLFYDWSGNQLAATAQLGPTSHTGTGLVETGHGGALPSGTRRVRISLAFHPQSDGQLADEVAFYLAAPAGPPVITPGGIVSASAFGGFPSIAPGSWIEIYGANLSATTRPWAGSDFTNGVGPTSLSGVSVSVGGQPAYIDYISPGQIDALVPSNAPSGAQAVTVTNGNGTSDSYWLFVNSTQPGLLAPPAFTVSGKQYVAALFSDGVTFALPANAISGVPTNPAKPGDVLTIYGVGFGPVTGGLTAGTVVTQQNSLTTPVQFFFGTTQATVSYYGLAPSFTGLYQFNVVVPNVAANGATPLSFTLGGVKGTQTMYIAVN